MKPPLPHKRLAILRAYLVQLVSDGIIANLSLATGAEVIATIGKDLQTIGMQTADATPLALKVGPLSFGLNLGDALRMGGKLLADANAERKKRK